MGRGSGRTLVCGPWLRGRRSQLAIRYRRDRSGRVFGFDGGVLRDQDASIGSVRPARGRCRPHEAATPAVVGGGVARRSTTGTAPCASTSQPSRVCTSRCSRRRSSWPVLAAFPTRLVPVAAQVRRVCRHRHIVPGAAEDLVVAARAHVGLRGLVRLYSSHLDGPEASVPQSHCYPSNAHASSAITARTAAATIR